MAFEVKRIDPLDRQPRVAVGVSIPFTSEGVFSSTFTTKDAIKNNIINFFLTGVGERFLNPNIGTGLRNLLFEQLTQDKIEAIEQEVRRSLRRYFPAVNPLEIKTLGIPDSNTVNFSMRYSISETGIEDTLSINFEQ